MQRPDWYYDDLRQVGIDFVGEAEVARYDERQADSKEGDAALIAGLGVEGGQIVADIGCGTGLFACAMAGRADRVYAVDISQAMLAATRRRAEALGLGNVVTVQAGFLSWEHPSASLDLVTSKFALHHLPDFWKAVALRRICDMLKADGRMFVHDVVFSCAPEEIAATVEEWAQWMEANTGWNRAAVATHVREEHSTFGWIMEGLIRQAGFDLLSAAYDGKTYARYIAAKATAIEGGVS